MKNDRSRTSTQYLALAAVAIVVVSAACGSDAGLGESEPTAPTQVEQPVLEPLDQPDPVDPENMDLDGGELVIGEVPGDFLDRLIADAIERSGVDDNGIFVDRAESVVWNNGSLGCPEPGGLYTQALVDGYHVVLETPGGDLDYRTAGTDYFIVCDRPLGSGY